MRGLERTDLCRTKFHAGKYEGSANEHAAYGPDRIERLREIEAPLGTLWVAKLCNEGIGRCFEKCKPAGDNKKRHQEETIAIGNGRRPEEKGSHSEEDQSGDDTRLLSRSAHQHGRGHGKQKVAEIEGGLYQPRLKA